MPSFRMTAEQAKVFQQGKYKDWGAQDPNQVDRSNATKTWDPNSWTNPFEVKMPYHPPGCQCPTCRATGSKGGVAPGLPYFPDLIVVDHDSVTAANKEEFAACIKELMKKTLVRNPMTSDYHSSAMKITYGGNTSRYLVLVNGGLELPSSDVGELVDAGFPDGVGVIEKQVRFVEDNGDMMRRNVQRWKC